MSDQQESDRPPGVLGWIISHPKTTILISLLFLMVCGLWLFHGLAESRLQRRIAAIRAKGEPTCVEDLNASRPRVPDSENMTPPIIEQAGRIKAFSVPPEWNEKLPIIGLADDVPTGRRLSREQVEMARLYLAKFPEELAIIHEALKLERGCTKVELSSPLFRMTGWELSEYRVVTKVVALEARVAIEDGDSARAGAILLDLSRVSRAMDGETFAVGALLKIAVDAMAWIQIERAVNQCGLDDETLRLLQAEAASPRHLADFKRAMLEERVLFIDYQEFLRSSSTLPDELIRDSSGPNGNPWRWVPILPAVDECNGLGVYSNIVEAVGEPDARTLHGVRLAQANAANLPAYSLLSRMLIPSFARSAELWVRSVGANRAIRAALACERYRLAHGDWPDDLQSLVPEYLEAVPIDPFDGRPLRYQRIPEGIKVWTIGEDLVDNGGDVMRLEPPKGNKRPTDFGWVLLNPDLRNLPAEPTEREPTGMEPSTASAPSAP